MNSLKFAALDVARGSRARGTIQVGTTLEGSPLQVPIEIIHGEKVGPKVWVLAGIDGDEIESIIGLQRALQEIAAAELRGSVIAILASNPSAVRNVSRNSPIDDKCLNEVFPGKEGGTFTERLAHRLFDLLTDSMKEDDLVLSLHGGGSSVRAARLIEVHGTGDEIEERGMELARIACNPDLSVIVNINEREGPWVNIYKGYLTRELYRETGVAPITIEAGGLGMMNPRDIRAHSNGILNVMRGTGMLEGRPIPPREEIVTTYRNERVVPSVKGFWLRSAEAGEMVAQNQEIAQVVDIYGEELENLRSPFDGIVLYMREYGVVDPLSSRLHEIYGANIGRVG